MKKISWFVLACWLGWCLPSKAAVVSVGEDPVSARQAMFRLIEALGKGEVLKAKSICLTSQEFAAFSKHQVDPKQYEQKLDGYLQMLIQELSSGLVFKDAQVADAVILPPSAKNHEVVIALVHAAFVLRDGKPLESPLVFSFVKQGSGWKLLLR